MPLEVIYIDDEEALCQMFEDNYASDEIHVRTFTNPTEGLAACCQGVDLVLVDYRMPHMTGDELAARLPPQVAVALVSGDLLVQPPSRFTKVFSKPYNFTEMQAFLDHHRVAKTELARRRA